MEQFVIKESEQFGTIRLILVGSEYYAAIADIKKALGASGSINGFTATCRNVIKCSVPTNGGPQQMNVVPVKEVKRLIFTSRKAKAIEFETWAEQNLLPFMQGC